MANQDEEAQRRLIAIFRLEAQERLSALSSALIELEQAAELPEKQAELLDVLVREAHSLKGAARAVSLLDIEAMGRALERVLAALKQREIIGSPPLFDALHRAIDSVAQLLTAPEAEEMREAVRGLTKALERMLAPSGAVEPPSMPPPAQPVMHGLPEEEGAAPAPAEMPFSPETVRIPSSQLGALMLEAEQLLSARLAEEHYVVELKAANRMLADWKRALAKSRHPPTAGRGTPTAVSALLETEDQRVKGLEGQLRSLERTAEHNLRTLTASLSNLLGDIKNALMLPASTLLELFPRMARDLSRAQAKEVDLVVAGGDIAIDKRILDEMKDPLIHLVRNSIDHGIESPAERRGKGKSERGRVTVSLMRRDSDKVEMAVIDDGAGVDIGRIRVTAVKQGLITSADAERLGSKELLALALRPGVTTSPIVTDISGRGLGLAIVQEKVSRLNGTLDLQTGADTGTVVKMLLPLTLATFRGVTIQCAERLFVIPTANVDQVLRSERDNIKLVGNRPTVLAAGQVLPLVRLADVLELPTTADTDIGDKLRMIVLSAGSRRIAFAVDAVQGEQEVVVKPLGRQLARVRNISGAALLGTGDVVPILNVHDLVASAAKRSTAAMPGQPIKLPPQQPKSLLVVEDSITTRTLLRNILEGAGYWVQTAVDGADALVRLRAGHFDLVVSDVAMPRMDGFELTTQIRADPQLAELPVVLVTALESREDRERGVEAGANAYIVKRSFDQSNLLETVAHLT